MRKGQIFVVSAPSGAGKTSLVNKVIERLDDIKTSTSYTTRQPRPSEVPDESYYFTTKDIFEEKIKHGDFAEYAEVYGEWYGTDWQQLVNLRANGFDVILEIDCQGARIIKEKIPESHLIFVLPPSLDALRERLKKRNENDQDSLDARLSQASNEIQQCIQFNYIVFNDQFDEACNDFIAIIKSHRLKLDALEEEQRIKLEKMIHM
jgi:guanylate kinase